MFANCQASQEDARHDIEDGTTIMHSENVRSLSTVDAEEMATDSERKLTVNDSACLAQKVNFKGLPIRVMLVVVDSEMKEEI